MSMMINTLGRYFAGRFVVSAVGASLWIIVGGIVIEPPAALMEAINKSNARLLRLFGRPAKA